MSKILVLGRDSLSTRILIDAVSNSYDVSWCAEKRDDKLQLIIKRVKRMGLFHVLSQLAFQILQKVIYRFSLTRIASIAPDLNVLGNYNPDFVVSNVNSKECHDFIGESEAFDVVLLSGTRILSREFIEYFKGVPIVNIHAGITPKYRGVHGGYWALASDDAKNFGATIHFVDEGIDTGSVISHVYITPSELDNFSTYPFLQQVSAVRVLLSRLPDIVEKKCVKTFSDESCLFESRVWSHPSIFEYIYNFLKHGVK